ncbi:MAG TPA: antibiotic biosynthesis monooxygenase family protein [Solirubrobacteraceae bacterium]|nr:antibiotic biosynthesis monooxygenase family protein [Solirubrobacteraceae bacterium]
MSVRMIVDVRVKPGSQEELTRAYAALRERAERQPGLIDHQLCEAAEDPERWLVISEWESLETSEEWDRSEDHARLLAPMRACFAQASRAGFQVRDGVSR